MTDARQLTQQISGDLKEVEKRIVSHPYLAALEEGAVAREKLRIFAGEQYYIVGSDLRSLALLVSRHAHLPSRQYLLGALQGEAAASEALLVLAAALGMGEADLQTYEPLAGCQAYPSYVAWLATYGSDAAVAAAFLVNLPAWGTNCGRMSGALKAKYALTPDDVRFLDLFAAPAPEFEADSLRVIQHGLDRGVDPGGIRRAARLIQTYELLYWDTLYEASR